MSLFGAILGGILGGAAGAAIGHAVTGDGTVHGGSSDGSASANDPPEPFDGRGTDGDDKIYIHKAGNGFLTPLGFDVVVNGQHHFMTKEQLEATKFDLGAGNDELIVDADVDANITANGGTGNDVMIGGKGNDRFEGDSGDDQLIGRDGNDILDGGSGNDRLEGNDGNDILNGGGGNDDLEGGAGNDILNGGDGKDYLEGGAGHDQFDGGSGNNTFSYDHEDFMSLPKVVVTEWMRR